MKVTFERAAIIGVGLLGASLGLALKARGAVGQVLGVGRRQESLDTALHMGAIDKGFLEIAPAVGEADLVVVATPAASVCPTLDIVHATAASETVVTDVASTKGEICRHASQLWGRPRRFVGAHPMAGSEKFGPGFGRADFYENSICLVEEAPDLDGQARAQVCALWEGVGARVIPVLPEVHDTVLARTSHLPHVLAAAMARLVDAVPNAKAMTGKGFLDVTRIAASRPEIWRDICMTNRAALRDTLHELREALDAFHDALERGDATVIEGFFLEGHDARQRLAGT